ncbi:rho GTPase-activating protein 23 isoform X2 [Spea bombifrons]|uniref:rho GTPase-activating protein 23 isoform X2 n=1 Tax=Spea bombifrons TaxID=233779 RepID=UPI002349ED0A|nr:rho GTPase-activating protein 23 isoform X2 [Spea bombifrons]
MRMDMPGMQSGVCGPRGPSWCWEKPVGVDCSSPEPCCIWLARSRSSENGESAFPGRSRSPRWGRTQGTPLAQRDGGCHGNSPPQDESFTWVGPKTLVIRKNRQGFGFTLRHFIVYPPESAVHSSSQEENGAAEFSSGANRLEPMDTIFVKHVKEGGPAQKAGLCTGDRLVKVNGESIIGKTYSQVIALIQNSNDALELSIMPRDEDILQLAYSQDAYLKGNEPYRGGAQSIPEPPPVFYPLRGQTPEHVPTYPTSSRFHRSSCDDATTVRSPMHRDMPRSSPTHHDNYALCTPHSLPPPRPYVGSPASSDRFRGPGPPGMSNHGWAPRHIPEPLGKVSPDPWELVANPRWVSQWERHQALCSWMSQQTPRRGVAALPPRRRSASQDRLGEVTSHSIWSHSVSQDTLHKPISNESWGHRAQSDNYLAQYGCSADRLDLTGLISPPYERPMWTADRLARTAPPLPRIPPSQPVAPTPREAVKPPPLQPSSGDSGYIGYRSYSPSFQRRTELLNAFSFRETGFSGLPTFRTAQYPSSPPSPPVKNEPSVSASSTDESCMTEERREEVVLRQKPPTGRKVLPVQRQVNVLFPEEGKDMEYPASAVSEETSRERPLQRVPPLPCSEEPLASIPFIDEPTSPSIDLRAKHIPASCVVSSAINSAPPISDAPSSPTFNFSMSRHYSQDCISFPVSHSPIVHSGSIKSSRRSSYLLAITTERSKSCDDGLNTFRDEGRIQRRPVGRVPSLRILRSFFTDGSLDSLVASEDGRSKHHSASELSDAECSDVRRDGWLLYKQILTNKGKVGGGLRQWKRVFAILRPHLLFLHKERPESRGQGPGEEEQPISILGSLVDISYSETKKKHVFRLMTPDFCEYLFQAEDRDDMLGWVKAIRENSRMEGEDPSFASQALINKKLNEYRKVSISGAKPETSPKVSRSLGIRPDLLWASGVPRSPKQDGASKEEVPPSSTFPWGINLMKKNKKCAPRAFGVRLEDCQPGTENMRVPLIVELCCTLVEQKGLEYMGIYRVPGNNAVVSSLQDQLNKGLSETNIQDQRWQDLNVISSLLKSFFRKLPEPLFTDDKYNDFIEANRLEDSRERLKTLRKLIRELPSYYYETLRFLVRHLKTIADHSEKNKMEPRNLALVFGPTLVRTSEDNMTDMVTHMPDRYKIVETLIQHADWFFSDEQEKTEKTPVDESDSQSVPNIEHLLPNIGRTAGTGDTSDSTNSDSAKARASRKELYARDILSIPFISAVNRKRRKRRDEKRFGSSTEEDDSEQEAARVGQAKEETEIVEGKTEAEDSKALVCSETPEDHRPTEEKTTEEEKRVENQWQPPGDDRIPADARSIVSGYSTLSTLCSEPVSSVRGGDEADDERSEFSHMETDTEMGGAREPEERPRSQDSFTSQRLIPGDTLARRRLVKGKLDITTETGQAPSRAPQRTRPAADDLCMAALRKPGSPETRRRKSAWRRHTVVLPGQLTDFNFNDWKEPVPGASAAPEPGARLSGGAWAEGRDSGLSSLESQKAKTTASQDPVPNKGAKSQNPSVQPGLRHYL